MFEFVSSGHPSHSLHGGDLHLGGSFEVGGVLGQAGGLGFHHFHRGGFLSSLVGLQSKAPCEHSGMTLGVLILIGWGGGGGHNACVKISLQSFKLFYTAASSGPLM